MGIFTSEKKDSKKIGKAVDDAVEKIGKVRDVILTQIYKPKVLPVNYQDILRQAEKNAIRSLTEIAVIQEGYRNQLFSSILLKSIIF